MLARPRDAKESARSPTSIDNSLQILINCKYGNDTECAVLRQEEDWYDDPLKLLIEQQLT